jgi:hypothetical protein
MTPIRTGPGVCALAAETNPATKAAVVPHDSHDSRIGVLPDYFLTAWRSLSDGYSSLRNLYLAQEMLRMETSSYFLYYSNIPETLMLFSRKCHPLAQQSVGQGDFFSLKVSFSHLLDGMRSKSSGKCAMHI